MDEFGVVGLGRMGGGLAWQALGKGYKVVGIDLHEPFPDVVERGIVFSKDLADLSQLNSPRVVFLYIHAGPAIDKMIDRLLPVLGEGDIIVDGGNSYWGDSIRRAERLKNSGIHFVDLGTSGGVEGARTGACFMVGGHKDALDRLEPILLDLAQPGGYVRCGGPGSGHFVKLVHNGIEFGMLQAIGEGMNLLEKFDQELPISDVLTCWQNGSVIRSWLMDLMKQQFDEQKGLTVPGYIEDTGEVNWLIGDAMRMEVPVPVIAQSVMQLFTSRDDKKDWAKAIAMMRHGFGGHPFGPKPELQEDRQVSRVGDIWKPTE
ncbi:MAG: NADP-dependent phosphogluconate dehydrogenase [Armatimonadetes bacterium]|nr:NADP-dependent phosphogluconate dehydrogenase [Armatimonadota bacterium]MBS1726979.1 NADP-dependent phosphogluconate dehydrogenase [Armatimonadota bacterium]